VTHDRPAQSGPGASDLPTAAAQLKISAEPMKGLSATGTVPEAEARYMIATFGIMWTFTTTTVGVVMTFRYDHLIAVAELLLGLATIVFIAIGGRRRGGHDHPVAAPVPEETRPEAIAAE